jgi:hypothetical protein
MVYKMEYLAQYSNGNRIVEKTFNSNDHDSALAFSSNSLLEKVFLEENKDFYLSELSFCLDGLYVTIYDGYKSIIYYS